MVINYDMPNGAEDYVHRIGRTGRAGASGELPLPHALLYSLPATPLGSCPGPQLLLLLRA